MRNALDLIKDFCRFDFEERNPEKALTVLAEHICWFGTSDEEDVQSREEARAYMKREMAQMPAPYRVEFLDEKLLNTGENSSSALLRARVAGSGVELTVRLSASAGLEDGESRILTMHMSQSSAAQKPGEFYPVALARETIRQMRQDLLSSTVPGGMMGGYIEKGFPFYFINGQMLQYLGYAGEDDFVSDVGGLISNCMHPDDRDEVDRQVARQIGESGGYTVEYRMRRRDGGYIWVHDIGKKVVAEDGRGAIISVCYDITDEKEHLRMIEDIVDAMHGGIAFYQFEDGGRLVPLYLSAGVEALAGFSGESPAAFFGGAAKDLVYSGDREALYGAVRSAVLDGCSSALSYRVSAREGWRWINGVFSRHGQSRGGQPRLLAVFTPVSQQFETQLKILDLTRTGIYIIDKNNYELYYINRAGLELMGTPPGDYTGKTCYAVLHHRDSPCEYCQLHNADAARTPQQIFIPRLGRYFAVNFSETMWNGKPARLEYLSDITAAKAAEEKLRRSEEVIEAASGFAGMWMWTCHVPTGTVHCYKKLRDDFGLPERLDRHSIANLRMGFISPEYLLLYRRGMERIQAGEREVQFDSKILYRDGTEHWGRCRFNVLSLEEGRPALVVCSCQPIDAEKALEDRVALEQRKPFADRKTLVAYAIADLTRNTVVSHRQVRGVSPVLAGMSFPEAVRVISESIFGSEGQQSFIKKHDREALLSFYERGGTTGSLEFRRFMSGGKLLWQRNVLDILRDPATGHILLYEYSYDVDREKKDQLAVDSLIDEEIEFIILVSVKTRQAHLVRAKQSFNVDAYRSDCDYAAVAERLISQWVEPSEQERCRGFFELGALEKALGKEKVVTFVHCFLGGERQVRRKKIRAFYLDDSRTDIVIARRDITDLYEEEQRQKQVLREAVEAANAANRAKSDFLAQMSHEIRTPMNAIIGMTKLAQESARNPEVADYLKKIDLSSAYLLGILNDVLDMSRIERGSLTMQPEWFCAGALLDSCIAMALSSARARDIRFVYPDVKPLMSVECFVDPLRMRQVLMNLINNALKFTSPGGAVTLKIQRLPGAGGDTENITVSDTGCGMSRQFLTRIFKPFEQERNPFSDQVPGTGLGLALVKRIAESMGGSVSVDSELGKGSAFTFAFPLKYRMKAAAKEQKAAGGAAPLTILKDKRVLLVDDHPLNREIAKKLLEHRKMLVDLAGNGREALDRFSASPAFYYDAVLMDIRMPVMNGLNAARELRALDRADAKRVPVIAMTANAFDEDEKRSKEAGMNAHLAKPIEPQLLFQTLAEQIGESRNPTKGETHP